ncbi:hypothetical protein ABPG75_013581 [Micractinium tetrahymenae]
MLPGAFSGTLLEADVHGAAAPPSFLGEAAGAGAAADPAAFLVGGPEDARPAGHGGYLSAGMPAFAPAAAGGSPGLEPAGGMGGMLGGMGGMFGGMGGMGGGSRATASDMLRSLESGCDFLLPSEPLDVPMSLLGSAGDAADLPLAATSPGTPPSAPGTLAWPSLGFPPIPEEAELLHAAPAAAPPPLLQPAASLPGSMTAAAAAAPGLHVPSPFTLPPLPPMASSPQPLFVPVPAPAAPPASLPPAPPAPLPAPPAPALFLYGRVSAGGDSTSVSEEPSPTSSSDQVPLPERSGASSAASGARMARVPRPASMPNLHLNLAEAGSGAVRKKAAHRPPRATSKPRGLPRSRSHSDLRGSSHTIGSAMAVVAATPAAADPSHLPHSAFLTPVHMRKGKGGRQPASDPRLDPNIDPKRAARIMANRLSAAKSKLKQKAQADKQRRGQRSRQGGDDEEMEGEEEEAIQREPEEHSQQMQAVEQQLAAQHLRPPSA